MSLPRFSVERPIAVAMVILATILLGVVSLGRLPIDLLPDVAYPQLVIYTTEPGSSPSEIERSVTEAVERAVAPVAGVQRVESVSREGVSLVTVRFAWGTDMDFAALNVRERLDNIRSALPLTASAPVVLRTDPRSEPILAVSVSGETDLRSLKELTEQVFKRRLEQLDGVAHAAVTGGLEREIQVDVDPRLLESYGITIEEISQALNAANVAGQGGQIRQGRYRYALRTLGEFRTPEEIGAVVLRLDTGVATQVPGAPIGTTGSPSGADPAVATVLLSDVAEITDGVRERQSVARFSGASGADGTGSSAEAVGMLIFKSAGANTVSVAEAVEGTLDELRSEYSEITLQVAMSQAGFISSAIANVQQSLVLGGILAFLVLFLFLREPRYPIAIAVAIPISVVGSFALLDAAGVSLNIMTLGGLALGIGMLMDNSIIVLENVFRHRELGVPRALAAVRGAEEVQGAMTASTLTTIAVFGPIVYIEGVAGELFGALSLAVAFSLLVSLMVAIIVVPSMAARWGADIASPGQSSQARLRRIAQRPFEIFDRYFTRFARSYHTLLEWSLDHRGRVVAFALSLLVTSLAIAVYLPRGVLPDIEQGAFRVRLELELGTPLDRTVLSAQRLEEILLADPGVEAVLSQIGRADVFAGLDVAESGLHTALLEVRLRDGATTPEVVARVREELRQEAATTSLLPPSAVTIESGTATALGRIVGAGEADLAIRIRADDLDQAMAHARLVEARLLELPRLANVRIGTEFGQPEILVEIDRQRAATYGVQPAAIAQVIERAMRGSEATQFADFDRRVPVIVRLPQAERESLNTLGDLRVQGVPVTQMISLTPGFGPSEVHRMDQGRMVPVYADIQSGGLGRAVADAEQAIATMEVPSGIRMEIGGQNEEMRRSFRDLAFAFVLSILLVYMILAAQFESLIQPFTVLLSVPLALIGAIWALGLTGGGLNTMSLIGIVILVGIVDNDAIVKIDMINQLRREGLPRRQAILEAGRTRLRPIIMTTVTTVLGMLPLSLGIGSGADLQAPMGVAVIGGLTVATLLTLIVIPVAYDLIESVGARLSGRSESSPEGSEDVLRQRIAIHLPADAHQLTPQ